MALPKSKFDREFGTFGEDGQPLPSKYFITLVGGKDPSGYARTPKVDSDGHLQVDVLSSPSSSTPSTIYNGRVAVTTAGTAVPLSSTSVSIQSVVIKALYSNTGTIYVGDSSVSSANGVELQSGDAISIDIDDLSKVYIDASVSGEGVSYLATA